MKLRNILTVLAIMTAATACFKLDKDPEGVLSTNNPFRSTGEIQNYINQFYETAVRTQDFGMGGGNHIAGSDTYSDNMAASAPVARINGALSIGNAVSLSAYTRIRNVNFLLNNKDNCDKTGNYNQLIGEAYYFRAWYYYQLLKDYGGVAIVKEPLNPDLEAMQVGQDSRTAVTDFILEDLDEAISLLNEQNSAATMRVHRDVARALKSEVALFEGTWEKYHKAKNDAFYDKTVTDDKIQSYLRTAAEAAKAVMDRGVWAIHNTGKTNDDYRVVFQTTNLDNNKEVLWYKRYDGDLVGNNVDRYLNKGGGGVGVTSSLVNDYLSIDGRPYTKAEREAAQVVYGQELLPTVRDPRLAQTVAMPGQVLRPDMQEGMPAPPLFAEGHHHNTTGYAILKHVQIDYTGNLEAEYKGATPAIQVRYADVLLNYAEALAELDGAGNESRIIAALKPLRDRVGMPAMDFDREYNTEADYPFRSLNKYIQAVRRERRVEQALEGRRFYDIARWAAADVLLVNWTPEGALFTGSNLPTLRD
ncbi:MAG: RagB/SusD family nutrient uptake outer membrane protein, partial [Bacteroidales bacterium]|nr:RagB/SusD family nutrient uptake outer membrane protein [Bacteroidales bacterium]